MRGAGGGAGAAQQVLKDPAGGGAHCRSHRFGIQAWKSFQASALSGVNFCL